MPTYSYRCTECSNAFDIHQAFTDDSLTVCPACGGVLRKVFSAVGVTFTGSGFYRNDSRAKPSGDSGSKDSGSKSTSGDSGSSGSAPAKSDAGSGPGGSESSRKPAAAASGSSSSPTTSVTPATK